jgi:hypothetical protein
LARRREGLDRAVGARARPDAQIDLARAEQEADRIAAPHPQMQAVELVQRAARRGHRKRRRVDHRDADAAVVGRPQNGDPRLFGACDPLRVDAGLDEDSVLGRLDRRAAQRELLQPHARAGGAARAGEAVGGRGRIERPEEGRRVRPLCAEQQRHRERRRE